MAETKQAASRIDFNEKIKVLSHAGVLPGHFARLYGYSRVSVSMWVNGRAVPHSLHAQAVLANLATIKKAYDDGLLPLKEPVPRKQRYQRLQDVVAAISKD